MSDRTSGIPYTPLQSRFRVVQTPKQDMNSSVMGTPSKPPPGPTKIPVKPKDTISAPLPAPSPKKGPSCCAKIGNCICSCAQAICSCLKSMFCCCCRKKEIDYVDLATREVDNFNGKSKKADRFASLKKIAILCRDHSETKTQYDEVVKKLDQDDFKQWLDINSSKTFEQVKNDPALMVRAADYAKAYTIKEDLAKTEKPETLKEIINIPIDDASDQKEFKRRNFEVHKATMLPVSERHFTLQDFERKYK